MLVHATWSFCPEDLVWSSVDKHSAPDAQDSYYVYVCGYLICPPPRTALPPTDGHSPGDHRTSPPCC